MSQQWIDRQGFVPLFDTVQRSAWRWECQGEYHEPSEDEPFRLWREGRADDSWMRPWVGKVRAWRSVGTTFERVRMVTAPLTEYLQWMLSLTHVNVEAGEDIRWITEDAARCLGMPSYDYYLFDDSRVVIMHFDAHGVSGAEVVDDPDVLDRHRAWRDLVWSRAIPHEEYMAERST